MQKYRNDGSSEFQWKIYMLLVVASQVPSLLIDREKIVSNLLHTWI